MTTRNRYYPAIQGEFEDELEAEDEAFFGGLANIAGSLLGEGEFEFEAEAEFEDEDEDEDEAEGFANPVRRVYRDAELMAHLANQAAQTESESEAEAFIGALVPLAAKLIPRAAQLISGNVPALVRGTNRIVRTLRRDPATRHLVTAVPVVLQRTAQSLADQVAAGRPIDAATVVRTLGTVTGRVLRGPNARRAVSAVDVFNRRYNRRRRWQQRAWQGVRPRRRHGYGSRYGSGYGSGYDDADSTGYGSGYLYGQRRRQRPAAYQITTARRRPAYARRYRRVRAR
jgi:hypothetical protein